MNMLVRAMLSLAEETTEETTGNWWDFFFNTVNLGGFEIPIWALVLAGLFLLIVVVSRDFTKTSKRIDNTTDY